MPISNRRAIALFMSCALVSAWAAPLAAARPKDTEYRVKSQAAAGSAHVAVISVAPWKEYAKRLQPTFELKPQDALRAAIPTTQQIDEALVTLRQFGIGINLPTSATEFSRTTTTDGEGTSKSTSEETTTRGPGEAVKPADTLASDPAGRMAKAFDLVRKLEGLTAEAKTDPMLQYTAAVALYQEVQLLSHYVEDAVQAPGMEPYLVRLQVALLPTARRLPYDAYANLSFSVDQGDAAPTLPLASPADSSKGGLGVHGLPAGSTGSAREVLRTMFLNAERKPIKIPGLASQLAELARLSLAVADPGEAGAAPPDLLDAGLEQDRRRLDTALVVAAQAALDADVERAGLLARAGTASLACSKWGAQADIAPAEREAGEAWCEVVSRAVGPLGTARTIVDVQRDFTNLYRATALAQVALPSKSTLVQALDPVLMGLSAWRKGESSHREAEESAWEAAGALAVGCVSTTCRGAASPCGALCRAVTDAWREHVGGVGAEPASDGLPVVVPLLVTDSLEGAGHLSVTDQSRQLAFSMAFLLGGLAGGAKAQSYKQEFERVLGTDLNAFQTVTRITDNTLRVRFGAMQQVSSDYAQVPRTYNVTLLLLAPAGQRIRIVSKTEMRDVKTGVALPGRTEAEVLRQVDGVLATRDFRPLRAWGLQSMSPSRLDEMRRQATKEVAQTYKEFNTADKSNVAKSVETAISNWHRNLGSQVNARSPLDRLGVELDRALEGETSSEIRARLHAELLDEVDEFARGLSTSRQDREQYLERLLSAVAVGDVEAFNRLVTTPGDRPALWADLAVATAGSQYSSTTFHLPKPKKKPEPHFPAVETPLAGRVSGKAIQVYLPGVKDVDVADIRAELIAKGGKASTEQRLPSTGTSLLEGGKSVVFTFDPIKAVDPAAVLKVFSPVTSEKPRTHLTVTLADLSETDAPCKPNCTLELADPVIVADGMTGTLQLSISIPKGLDPKDPDLLTIGAQLALDKGVLQVVPAAGVLGPFANGAFPVTGSGLVTVTLTNLRVGQTVPLVLRRKSCDADKAVTAQAVVISLPHVRGDSDD